MEFEQYLERDILTFLDSKIYKKENTSRDREEEYGLYLTKDYLKELNYALDNDELTRAKKLFDELKTNYSRLPKNSVERKKIYSLLEKMYEKIQNYVRIKEGKIEIIKQGDMEIFKDTTEKFSSIADKMEKAAASSLTNDTKEIKINSSVIPIKRTELPIRMGAKTESKKDSSEENILLEKKKSHDQETETAESETTDNAVTEKHDSSREIEKTVVKEIKRRGEKGSVESSRISEFPEINQNITRGKDIERLDEKQGTHDEWKEEIIHKTTKHLERLKVHVVDKLLEELRKKLDEKSDEQNKKIESLRNEIVTLVIEELDKRLKREKRAVSEKIELLRDEILDKVYQQAPQIISSTDNYDSDKIYRSTSRNKHLDEVEEDSDSIVVDQHVDYTNKINNNDIYTRTEEENVDTSNQEDIYVEKTQLVDGQYSNEDLRLVYEQAIYNMFENRYTEAAKLFKKIIDIQPTNKAAKIRLRECMEKQPTTSENKDPKEKTKEMLSEIDGLTEDTDQEISTETDIDESENTYELDETLTEPINNFTEDIRGMTLDEGDNSIMLDQYGNKINTETYKNADSTVNQYTSEELRVVYEQAIYYMSDNKYNEAAKLFKKIIDIQPTNKAAKIRLKECIEKQPTILSETETIADSDLESVVKQKQIDTEESSNTDNLEKPEDGTEITAETADKPNDFVEDIKRLQRRDSIKQKYTDEELQKMYEEAIYTMFQNNYSEAAKIFHQILRIRPENKAARIRLQECKEASGNA